MEVYRIRTGSTNDITAYRQTKLYNWWMRGMIPANFQMVLDEAYSSIGGDNHLTPFTKSQLKKARAENPQHYLKLRAFNNILSSQRITIERAFGILVRKWGILWKPLGYSLRVNTLITMVCAKLHNVCVNRWMKKHVSAEHISSYVEANFIQQTDASIFMREQYGSELHESNDGHDYHDAQYTEIFANKYC